MSLDGVGDFSWGEVENILNEKNIRLVVLSKNLITMNPDRRIEHLEGLGLTNNNVTRELGDLIGNQSFDKNALAIDPENPNRVILFSANSSSFVAQNFTNYLPYSEDMLQVANEVIGMIGQKKT